MARKPSPPDEALSSTVRVRMTEAEAAALDKRAEESGLTRSAVARQAIGAWVAQTTPSVRQQIIREHIDRGVVTPRQAAVALCPGHVWLKVDGEYRCRNCHLTPAQARAQ